MKTCVWGSPPTVHLGEHCPACARFQFGDHPIRLITVAEVDEDFLEEVFEMVYEDDRGHFDWYRLWEGSSGIDGTTGNDGRCWMLPSDLADPVFDKIKRGIRKMKTEG